MLRRLSAKVYYEEEKAVGPTKTCQEALGPNGSHTPIAIKVVYTRNITPPPLEGISQALKKCPYSCGRSRKKRKDSLCMLNAEESTRIYRKKKKSVKTRRLPEMCGDSEANFGDAETFHR